MVVKNIVNFYKKKGGIEKSIRYAELQEKKNINKRAPKKSCSRFT